MTMFDYTIKRRISMKKSMIFFRTLINVVLTIIVFFGVAVVLDLKYDIIKGYDFILLRNDSDMVGSSINVSRDSSDYTFDSSSDDAEQVVDSDGNDNDSADIDISIDEEIVNDNTPNTDDVPEDNGADDYIDDGSYVYQPIIKKQCQYCNAILSDDDVTMDIADGNYMYYVNTRVATCTETGYTGDVYCKSCRHLINRGFITLPLGHTHLSITGRVNPTCITAGYTGDTICNDCGQIINLGENIPATGHLHTEMRNALAPTYTSTGYTGDEYCVDCGLRLCVGTIIPQLKTQAQIDLENIISDIRIIENLSKQYNSSRYNQRTVIYVRSAKYKGYKWEIVGGELESDFPNYIKNNQGNHDVTYLRSKGSMTDVVTGQGIDFVHMFATMSAILVGKNEGDLGGWGGDLCQLTAEIAGKTTTLEELQALVLSKFNKRGSCFDSDDLLADIDAVNIITVYYNMPYNERSISQAIYDYYDGLTQSKRLQMFSEKLFGTDDYSTQEKCDIIYSRIVRNAYLKMYCNSVNINVREGKANELELKACISAFVDYLEN